MESSNSKSNQQEKTVIFLHIPKAAGTTLNMIFKRQYEPPAIYEIRPDYLKASIDEFKKLPSKHREKIRILRGHIGFGLHNFLPQPSTYITIMRNPVDRVISHYYYIRTLLENGIDFSNRPWFHDARYMCLKDYVRYGKSPDLRNGQTKLLSGEIEGWWGAETDAVQYSTTMLETAKNNLKDYFAVVGLSERFDETLILLRRIFDWKMPFYVPHNLAKNRPLRKDISKDIMDAIEKCNELDIELYRYAKEMFEDRIRNQNSSFAGELKVFQLMNKYHNKVHRLRCSARRNGKALLKHLRH